MTPLKRKEKTVVGNLPPVGFSVCFTFLTCTWRKDPSKPRDPLLRSPQIFWEGSDTINRIFGGDGDGRRARRVLADCHT